MARPPTGKKTTFNRRTAERTKRAAEHTAAVPSDALVALARLLARLAANEALAADEVADDGGKQTNTPIPSRQYR